MHFCDTSSERLNNKKQKIVTSYQNDEDENESVDSDDSEDEIMHEADESVHIEDEEMECDNQVDEYDEFETEEGTEMCVSSTFTFDFVISSCEALIPIIFFFLAENWTGYYVETLCLIHQVVMGTC
eukprot:Seg5754.3 transcript_id=Seg5754.3/GoldUCD/mRNA.D3Y31 product="hypothetical protein" protein_id=Seg5754.3/GoldUCD/D3Y31